MVGVFIDGDDISEKKTMLLLRFIPVDTETTLLRVQPSQKMNISETIARLEWAVKQLKDHQQKNVRNNVYVLHSNGCSSN